METKILIIVSGGIVQQICANHENVKIVIVDYDDQSDEPVHVSPSVPDVIEKDMYKLFTDKSDPVEMEIRDTLKDIKF